MGVPKVIEAMKVLERLTDEERRVALSFFCPICGKEVEEDLFPRNICDTCPTYIRVEDWNPTAY